MGLAVGVAACWAGTALRWDDLSASEGQLLGGIQAALASCREL